MDHRRLSLALVLLTLAVSALSSQTPDWANDRKADYDQIAGMVKSALLKEGMGPVEAGKDAGTFSFMLDGSSFVMNLYNIYATCVGTDKNEWAALVNDYVGKVRVAQKEEREALAAMESWSSAKGRLFVKVYPLGYVQNMREGYVGFEDVPGMLSVVVIDLPSSVTVLKPEYLGKWKKEAGEVFLAAKANTLTSLKGQKMGSSDLGQGESMSYYYDESNVYIASLALDRDLLKAHDGAYGVFLSVPSRSIFLIQPVKGLKFIYSLALNLAMNTADFFKKASGPISAEIFWYHQGRYYPIKIDITGPQNKMEFPEELKALMK